jgi:inner membrane protein
MNTQQSGSFRTWVQESVTMKMITVGILILLLLIPASMIRNLIRERERTRNEVIHEISDKWGKAQTITGPFISIPYKYSYEENGKRYSAVQYAHFLPEKLSVSGNILPKIRYRSIYKVVVYNSLLNITGHFSAPDFSMWKIQPENIMYDEAVITVGIPDMRGIKDNILFSWNALPLSLSPGTVNNDLVASGLVFPCKFSDTAIYHFSFELNINGSESLHFVPLGKETCVDMHSAWADPSFNGAFLPDTHNITNKGFDAFWKILHVNRNYPQQWQGSAHQIQPSSFGLELIIPVDRYQKNMRSAKYALMFTTLTFLIFFFAEVLNKRKVHPIQYLLIGLSLCIFYTLLLSLSEHMDFALAYLLSSVSIISLITAYSATIFKNRKLSLLTCFTLIILYLFLFTILQLQDYSLLIGSLGLLIVMAVIMYLSRKIDWYSGERNKTDA